MILFSQPPSICRLSCVFCIPSRCWRHCEVSLFLFYLHKIIFISICNTWSKRLKSRDCPVSIKNKDCTVCRCKICVYFILFYYQLVIRHMLVIAWIINIFKLISYTDAYIQVYMDKYGYEYGEGIIQGCDILSLTQHIWA